MSNKFNEGDRVKFHQKGLNPDIGTIIATCDYNRYWVKWDSNNEVANALTDSLTLIDSTKPSVENKNVLQLLQEVVILSVENGDFNFATKLLNLIQGK